MNELKATGRKIILKRNEESFSSRMGRIEIPENSTVRKEVGVTWKVISIGDKVNNPDLTIGDNVIVDSVIGDVIVFKDDKYRIVDVDYVLGVVE